METAPPLTKERLSLPLKVTVETDWPVLVLKDMPTRSRRLVPLTACDQVKLEAVVAVHAEAESDGGTGVDVAVGVGVLVAVGVGVAVAVAVGVGVAVDVAVAVGVGVAVLVAVAVGVGVDVAVGHGPPHGVAVAVAVGVAQAVPMAIMAVPKVSGVNPEALLWTPPPKKMLASLKPVLRLSVWRPAVIPVVSRVMRAMPPLPLSPTPLLSNRLIP